MHCRLGWTPLLACFRLALTWQSAFDAALSRTRLASQQARTLSLSLRIR